MVEVGRGIQVTAPGIPETQTDANLRRSARIAGLRDFQTPTLEQVERRRFELLALSFSLLLSVVTTLVALSAYMDLPNFVENLGRVGAALPFLLVGLTLAFCAYVWEKERHLGRLSRTLVNERVLSAALSNRLKEISTLSEAGKAVVSMLELEDVLKVILDSASHLLEADEGSVQLVDGDDLVVAAEAGRAQRYLGSRRSRLEGLSGYVARTREPLLIEGRPDLSGYGILAQESDRHIESAISVPLEARDELLGILNLNVTTGDRRYNEYDLRALRLFGEHAAMAIRHARALRRERDLREQLAQVDHMRSELIGTMTHDLKTPLTTILGNARLLQRHWEDLDEAKRGKSIAAVVRQSERLLALIDKLLVAARSQVTATLDRRQVDLVPVVSQLVADYSNAHDRRVAVEAESASLPAFVDVTAVEQIVANLLENAVKHTPPATAIRVGLRRSGAQAQIVVSDDGPGVPPDLQDRMFEPFHQGAGAVGGVGLGLFIVSGLASAMGGRVAVDSRPGRGATFTVSLPTEGMG